MNPEKRRPTLESESPKPEQPTVEGAPEKKSAFTNEVIRAQLQKLERVLVTDIRKRLSALTLSRDPSFLERLATVAVLTQAVELGSQLLAQASSRETTPTTEAVAEVNPVDALEEKLLAAPTAEVQARLQSLLTARDMNGELYGSYIDTGTRYLKAEALDQPLVLSESGNLRLGRAITDAEAKELIDDSWKESNGDYVKTTWDAQGNKFEGELTTGWEPGSWIESVSVQMALQVDEPENPFDDGTSPIRVDFSPIDPTLGVIDSGIYQRRLKPVGHLNGTPIYVRDSLTRQHDTAGRNKGYQEKDRLLGQLEAQKDAIDSGVRSIYALYGTQPDIKGYLLENKGDDGVAAYASYRTELIGLTENLFKSVERGWTAADVEVVASHEAAHHTSYDYGITNHPAVEAVFAKYGDRLKRLNEGALVGNATGHGQDNTDELCATIFAAIEHDKWIDSIQTLTLEDRTMYIDVLQAMEIAHLDAVRDIDPTIPKGLLPTEKTAPGTKTLTGNEPVFRLLRDRIKRLREQP